MQLDNVVLSDRTAWYSEESVAELQTKAALEVAHAFPGEIPNHMLNRRTTYPEKRDFLYWSFPTTVIPVLRFGNAEEICRAANCLLGAGFQSTKE